MKSGLIINDIHEAEHLARNRDRIAGKDCLLFSTDSAIDVFLDRKYGITCMCLSRFLTSEAAAGNIAQADRMANETVDLLDDLYSRELGKATGLGPMRFFRALYSYQAYFQFNMYLSLSQAVKAAHERYGIDDMLCFDRKLNEFFRTRTSLCDFVEFVGTGARAVEYKRVGPDRAVPHHWTLLRRLSDHPLLLLRMIRRKATEILRPRYRSFSPHRKTILLFEPLYDLSFLHEHLSGYNVLYYASDSTMPQGFGKAPDTADRVAVDFASCPVPDETGEDGRLKRLVIKDIGDDFAANAGEYFRCLSGLHRINGKTRISLGIWGNSPVVGLKSLVFEYLIANGIRVLGCQHGGLLGNIFNTDVYMCDTSRCTHYISYGFDKSDLMKVYPDKRFDTEIIPLGTTKERRTKPGQRPRVDLMFPLANTVPMLVGGMIREKPDVLIEKQVRLLEHLDSLPKHRIAVKQFPRSYYQATDLLSLLGRPRNLQEICDLSFMDALQLFDIKSVLIEHPSTALYEALAYDLEIFVLNDNIVRPIEGTALEELKKRAHYSENVEETISTINRFLNGNLERKRDDTFYCRHVHRDRTQENVLQLIEKLVQGNA